MNYLNQGEQRRLKAPVYDIVDPRGFSVEWSIVPDGDPWVWNTGTWLTATQLGPILWVAWTLSPMVGVAPLALTPDSYGLRLRLPTGPGLFATPAVGWLTVRPAP